MKKVRRGFTLIEVSLFLAITALIFVGVVAGTQNSIFQQRYDDTVQDFTDFLRNIYSQTINVGSEGFGRSNYAIYGKLVIFDEQNGENKINSYNVIGKVEGEVAGCQSKYGVLEKLACLDANVVLKKEIDGEQKYEAVGFVENYVPRWSSQIQKTNGWNNGYEIFKGSLLIVRSPNTGTIHTFVMDEVIDVEAMMKNAVSENFNVFDYVDEGENKNYLRDGRFLTEEIDFCVNPNGAGKSNLRRDVRVEKGATNTSGIEIVSDGENIVEIKRNGETVEVDKGNKCEP